MARRQFQSLVVEGETEALGVICAIFEKLGMGVLVAETPREGLDILLHHAEDISVLFIDAQAAEDFDGFDLAIAAAQAWPDIKIILASDHMERFPELPPCAFIAKPFRVQTLFALVRQLLARGI